MIEIATLFSGSSGNSTLIRTQKTAVLIDAGRNCKAVCASLGEMGMSLEDISCIFITHEHSDHISALDVMERRRSIPIHVTKGSAGRVCEMKDAARNAVIHDCFDFSVRVGDLVLTAFPLPHDSAAHVGYLAVSDDKDRAGVATDMGKIVPAVLNMLSGCRQAVIEANHDEKMLRGGAYPYLLKQRILSDRGHLSNDAAAILCRRLAETGTQHFMLAHLSMENNDPELAFSTVRNTLDGEGFSHVTVKVAPREHSLML